MNIPVRIFLVLAALALLSPAARAQDNVLALSVNASADLCLPLLAALRASPDYFDYDPVADSTPLTDNGPYMSSGDNLVMPYTTLTKARWGLYGVPPGASAMVSPMTAAEFAREAPDKVREMNDNGNTYGAGFAAYKAGIDFDDGDYDGTVPAPERIVYKLVPRSRLSPLKLPEIYMQRGGDGLGDVVDDLHANEVLVALSPVPAFAPAHGGLQQRRGYPLVRAAGHVDLYRIDRDGEAHRFYAAMICRVESESAPAPADDDDR